MPAAARNTDLHTCPQVNADGSPHVGGPITAAGTSRVFIGKLPAAVANDICNCSELPSSITMGSQTVLIGGSAAARMGDQTAHPGGMITGGEPTVLIGG